MSGQAVAAPDEPVAADFARTGTTLSDVRLALPGAFDLSGVSKGGASRRRRVVHGRVTPSDPIIGTAPPSTPLLDSRPWRLWVVPHTHWDREWYLPLEDFRVRLGEVVDEVIETLEARSEYRFTLDGQAIVIEDYLEIRPEMEGRLRALLVSGRIETGPSYVLPDEFLVGGESLVRNLLHGRAVCERFGAAPAAVGYLPDSFGHPAQLPQILRGFGLETFVFWRGLGDDRERLGARFHWRAPDGSEVLALPQPWDYAAAASLGHSVRSSQADPALNAAERIEQVLEAERHMLDDPAFADLLLGNGYDHASLQGDLPEVLDGLRAVKPHVSARIARLSEYVEAVTAAGGEPPRFGGELAGGARANVLRGVNSARMYLKQANERCERELASAETLSALAALARPGFRFPRGELRLAWRELMRNHPHDSICGCSVDETHDDMAQRFRSALQIARRVADRALHALGAVRPRGDNEVEPFGLDARYRWTYRPLPGGPLRSDTLTGAASFANTLPFARRRLVALELPDEAPERACGVQLERHAGGTRAWMELALGPFSAATVRSERPPASPVIAARATDGRTIENARYRVTADDGTLTVFDRRSGASLGGVHRFDDLADRGDSYTFCALEGDTPLAAGSATARVRATGPVYAELEIAAELDLPASLGPDRRSRSERSVRCSAVTRVRLAAGSERIEFTTTLSNRAADHRLRVRFPTPKPFGLVRAEGHFMVVPRDPRPVWNGSWFEPPHDTDHTLGAVAAGGVTLLTKGLPEYEATEDGELALTLLRCVGWLSRDDLSTRRGGAGPQLPVPGAQCLGEHVFEYALELGEPGNAGLVRRSQDYRFDFAEGPPGAELEGPLSVDGAIVFSALKGVEDGDGVVLRVFNPGSDPAEITLPRPARRCRLDERAAGEAAAAAVTLGPGEIATLRLPVS
jgi:2-O-(6-phospho-alpha-D-mannosyl)-D-glycerate hydrolase